ncbi:hypothetical protein JX266_002725 [Neoarthrinium moseri]|nr:hypothetical protein JX266_002725 [Neoarthrinium moseri]
MKEFSCIITALWLGSLGTAIKPPTTDVVHEQRHPDASSTLIKRWKPHSGLQLPMRIGLKQNNIEKAPRWLMDVAHPTSKKYGKHWTAQEVIEAFKPSDETVDSVKQWLEDSGIAEWRITHSNNKAWLAFEASLDEAETLLHSDYLVYQNTNGRMITDCESYTIPQHLTKHIDYITPGVKGVDITSRLRHHAIKGGVSSGQVRPRGTKLGRRRFKPRKRLSTAPIPKDLSTCDKAITPVCLQTLYQFESLDTTSVVSSNNSLGIFEEADYYSQVDLNLFYAKYAPHISKGWGPELNSIDGGEAPVPFTQAGGESSMDFQLAIPIIYPQKAVVYQTDDGYYSTLENKMGIFNTFLDAIDGSYCTYCSDGECGNDPELDPVYPDSHHNGYKGKLMCGVYKPTAAISISYGKQEQDLPAYYQKRQCNEFLKLGLQGVSIFVASGDTGVGGIPGDGTRNGCLRNGKVFSPTQPNSCPWLTNVGASMIPRGKTVNDPEVAAASEGFYSGGGFSNIVPIPDYQSEAVENFFEISKPRYAYYHNGSYGSSNGLYNRNGRGIPDVAANGVNIAVYVGGSLVTEGGTSASAPIFAALVTRINEERLKIGKSVVGFVNPVLYAHPEVFNDIVNGTNPGCDTQGFSCAPGWVSPYLK